MKRFLCIIVVCITLLSLFVLPASANISVNISYSAQEKSLKVYGEASGYILITMPLSGMKPEEITEEYPPIIAKQVFANGNYEILFTLPGNMTGGKYEIYVSDGKENQKTSFFHINSDSEAIPLLNAADNIDEFTNIIEQYAADLGIDEADAVYTAGKDEIINLLYLEKREYETVFDFSDEYTKAYAIYSLGSADADKTAEILEKYENILKISFLKYDNATTDVKEKVAEILSETDFSEVLKNKVTFSDFYNELIPYAAILCCDTWYDLKSVITDTYMEDFSELLDNSDYKKLKDKNKVYKTMIKEIFSSISDVKEAFDKAAEQALKSEKKTQSTSTGGIGGTSFSGGASIGPVTVTTTPQKEDNESLFTDLNPDHWSYKAVKKMSDIGIISGYEDGSFRPDKLISRAEFTKLAKDVYERLSVKREKDLIKVATLGDSLTQGLFGEDGKYTTNLSYSTYLQEYLGEGFEVKNFGRSSHGLYENHQYYYRNTEQYKDALEYDADIVIIIFGSNDMKTDYWSTIKSNYDKIYREFVEEFINLDSNPMIIIGLPTPVYGDSDLAKDRPMKNRLEVIETEKKVASDMGITVVDTFSLMEGREECFPDGVHFNIEGGKAFGRAFKDAIYEMYGKNTKSVRFDDVKSSDWFFSYVKDAAEKGLVSGSGGYFLPNNNITREDATLIMYRIVSKMQMISGGESFADSGEISDYAQTAVKKMAAAKLISGTGGQKFAPRENLTRAQAAQMMYNILN